MATGFGINSGWLRRSHASFGNLSVAHQLRKEGQFPTPQPWSWINFYFGTNYAGTATNKTLNDTPAVDANVAQVNGVSVDGTGAPGDEWRPGGTNTAVADVNVVSVNGVDVAGTGALGDEWGPA